MYTRTIRSTVLTIIPARVLATAVSTQPQAALQREDCPGSQEHLWQQTETRNPIQVAAHYALYLTAYGSVRVVIELKETDVA